VAYGGSLAGKGKLLYMLTRGREFADGDAGGLCTGVDTEGCTFRPFAVIGVSREVCPQHLPQPLPFLVSPALALQTCEMPTLE
jgi:hypothetical protein